MIVPIAAASIPKGAVAPPPSPAGLLVGSGRVMVLALSRMTGSFRVYLLLAFGLLPAFLMYSRGWWEFPDRAQPRYGFFAFLFVMAHLQFFLLFISVVLGSSAFSEEVDDQTL